MFSTKMACNCLFKLGLGLGVGLSNVFAILPVLAAPAPVFEPILDELSTSARPVRLPTFVPSDVELYPFVRQHFGILILNLGVTPNCEASSCMGLNIATTPEPSYWPPPEDDSLTPVDLGNGIQGYSTGGGGFGSVQWIQGGSLYALTYKMELFSSEDAIAMAISMASEPPVSTTQ